MCVCVLDGDALIVLSHLPHWRVAAAFAVERCLIRLAAVGTSLCNHLPCVGTYNGVYHVIVL